MTLIVAVTSWLRTIPSRRQSITSTSVAKTKTLTGIERRGTSSNLISTNATRAWVVRTAWAFVRLNVYNDSRDSRDLRDCMLYAGG